MRAGSTPRGATKPLWTLAVLTLVVLSVALGGARAQDTSTPQSGGTQETQAPAGSSESGASSQDTNSQQPIAPYGQDNSAPIVTENPPITGIDTPSLEPHSAPLSYLQPGVTASESVASNGAVLGIISRDRASFSSRLASAAGIVEATMGSVGMTRTSAPASAAS